MARVALITTGAMEELALQKSLERIFPEHEFIAPKRLDGFTSSRLPPDYASLRQRRPLLNIEKFAKTLIGRIAGGRRDEPRADFVIGIEDMELCNADCPANITGALRDAVAQNLEQWADGPKRERLRLALGERCSFHLMTPMTEAYFFADPDALARATGPGLDHPNLFDPSSCDIEGVSRRGHGLLEHTDRPQGASRATRLARRKPTGTSEELPGVPHRPAARRQGTLHRDQAWG